MSHLLIHIGYHKTASTWLQRFVFPSRELGLTRPFEEAGLNAKLVAPHDLHFDADAVRASMAGKIEAARSSGLVPVLSSERLSGDLKQRMSDSARLADRLAAVFPEARVLIVIREQRAMILSTYKQHVVNGGLFSLGAFVAGGGWWWELPFEVRQYAYDELIAYYQARFGASNVLVLPYELFLRAGREFVRRIVEFAGSGVHDGALEALPLARVANRGQPAVAIAVKRYLNRYLRHHLTPWGGFGHRTLGGRLMHGAAVRAGTLAPAALNRRLDERMREVVASKVGGVYGKSNARTSELIGIDLAEYGYDVGKPRPD